MKHRFGHGITLEQFRRQALDQALAFAVNASGWPARDIELSEEETALIAQKRPSGSSVPTGTDLANAEIEEVFAFRAQHYPRFEDLNSEISAAQMAAQQFSADDEVFVLPYTRHVVLVKKPVQRDWDRHKLDNTVCDEKADKREPLESATDKKNLRDTFAKKHVVYPASLPRENLNLLSEIYTFTVQLACDSEITDSLKLLVQ